MMRGGQVVGAQSLSEPLLARPMGVRAVETMTASGMWSPSGRADAQRCGTSSVGVDLGSGSGAGRSGRLPTGNNTGQLAMFPLRVPSGRERETADVARRTGDAPQDHRPGGPRHRSCRSPIGAGPRRGCSSWSSPWCWRSGGSPAGSSTWERGSTRWSRTSPPSRRPSCRSRRPRCPCRWTSRRRTPRPPVGRSATHSVPCSPRSCPRSNARPGSVIPLTWSADSRCSSRVRVPRTPQRSSPSCASRATTPGGCGSASRVPGSRTSASRSPSTAWCTARPDRWVLDHRAGGRGAHDGGALLRLSPGPDPAARPDLGIRGRSGSRCRRRRPACRCPRPRR